MRALVVYESMYGNTREIARNIADGLRADYEVTLVPVAEAAPELVAGADLLVAGAPTHMHGLSSVVTRRMAARAAAKDGSGLRMDQDAPAARACRSGCRTSVAGTAWPPPSTPGSMAPRHPGRASRAIARLLKRHGYRLIAAPQSFLVSWETTLLDGVLRPRRALGPGDDVQYSLRTGLRGRGGGRRRAVGVPLPVAAAARARPGAGGRVRQLAAAGGPPDRLEIHPAGGMGAAGSRPHLRSGRRRPCAADDTVPASPASGDPRSAWASYALDAELMCIRQDRSPRWTAPAGLTFRDWLRGGRRPAADPR